MIISNLEYLEIISQQIGREAPEKVNGGLVIFRSEGISLAIGGTSTSTMVRVQAVTISIPVILP
jgi:hypothetical protein